jgi:hypothetical protein
MIYLILLAVAAYAGEKSIFCNHHCWLEGNLGLYVCPPFLKEGICTKHC